MKDYIIITPKEWGPLFWNFLHSIPNNLTKDNACYFNAMFKKLSYVIPCNVCKEHYDKFRDENKLEMRNITKIKMKKWILQLHNSVNLKLGKKEFTLKESNKVHKKINDTKFLNLLNYIIKKALQDKISVFRFLNFMVFFEVISEIYPNKKIRERFKDINKLEISDIKELDNWFKNCLKYRKEYFGD